MLLVAGSGYHCYHGYHGCLVIMDGGLVVFCLEAGDIASLGKEEKGFQVVFCTLVFAKGW